MGGLNRLNEKDPHNDDFLQCKKQKLITQKPTLRRLVCRWLKNSEIIFHLLDIYLRVKYNSPIVHTVVEKKIVVDDMSTNKNREKCVVHYSYEHNIFVYI